MVFGNMGDTSGTGVAFTRNTFDGTNELYGEYLVNAQGEDVVAGIRTPEPISQLKQDMPEAYDEFVRIGRQLEAHYRDVQDLSSRSSAASSTCSRPGSPSGPPRRP